MADDGHERALPAEVRQQLITIAADVIGKRPVAELPAAVRRFARFAPSKRVRMGAADIAAALAADERFRESVGEVVTQASPELVEQVSSGSPPETADPVDIAVIAYLIRPPGWQQRLEAISADLLEQNERRTAEAELSRLESEVQRLTTANTELSRTREDLRAAAATANADQAKLTAELQHRIRMLQGELRSAQRAAEHANRASAVDRAEYERLAASHASELRKARARIASLEAELDNGRRTVRAAREHDDARLWLLLEQISAAAGGLQKELDLTRPAVSPADSVASADQESAARPSTLDPSYLDRLLDGAHVHLIVDGYNLSKTGYGDLPLADQRTRLVTSLGALAARTKVEVTVAFDGTAAPTGVASGAPSPRGVRVLFSAVGQLADDLIRDLVQAEPPGRTVLVASSDQAVAARARGSGAWPVAAAVLLSRLER
jgi:predicted RNA-binding protein with PIN domain